MTYEEYAEILKTSAKIVNAIHEEFLNKKDEYGKLDVTEDAWSKIIAPTVVKVAEEFAE